MVFKEGDEVVCTGLFHPDEKGWVGTIVKVYDLTYVEVDMSKYMKYAQPINYRTKELKLATKLDKALL